MTETRCLIWCAVSSRAQNKPDKISLPQQEAKSRALAEENGWRIVDVLSVPGHSRRYIDFHELAEDAAQKDIDAFYRLDQHWNARDFDVLIVLDGNRFARTQALHAYITEKTIEMDARIFSLIDGWVDKQNYRMWIAMNGYKSAGEIDRFVRERDAAMDARAAKGLPVSSRVIFSHKVIRDPNSGKAIRLEVDESKRRLWDDLAILILEGLPGILWKLSCSIVSGMSMKKAKYTIRIACIRQSSNLYFGDIWPDIIVVQPAKMATNMGAGCTMRVSHHRKGRWFSVIRTRRYGKVNSPI